MHKDLFYGYLLKFMHIVLKHLAGIDIKDRADKLADKMEVVFKEYFRDY